MHSKSDSFLVPEDFKKVLKKPLGIILRHRREVCARMLLSFITDFSPPVIVSVGDVVSETLTVHVKSELGERTPSTVMVVDLKTKRHEAYLRSSLYEGVKTFYTENPRSTITRKAIATLSQAISAAQRVQGEEVLVKVRGEEDLLVLPSVLLAPLKSLVIYGQPDQGMVVVIVSRYTKDAFRRTLLDIGFPRDLMKTVGSG